MCIIVIFIYILVLRVTALRIAITSRRIRIQTETVDGIPRPNPTYLLYNLNYSKRVV